MTTGEQIDKAVKLTELVPYIQSKLDKLEVKVSSILDISNYVECEVCGSLVNKSKAQVLTSVRSGRRFVNLFECSSISEYIKKCNDTDKEAVLHYVCNHCDVKKYEKELKKCS